MALTIGELVGYVRLDTTGVAAGARQTQGMMAGLGRGMGQQGMAAGRGWARGANGALQASRGGFVTQGQQIATGLGRGIESKAGILSNAWARTVGVLAVGQAVKGSVQLEASYSKTMAQIAASTGAPQAEMSKLDKLATRLGADTAFSAGEAAAAMLELAKAGITTKDIMGGALAGTLTLAAAGGTDLATASTIAANAMNTFGLKGTQMNQIAAALAGGANASSASVESLGQALEQVGPGAKNAGLSLQETVAALSAFDAAGVKGSDAGTSLKTFLAALVPQTEKASEAFAELGLWSEKTGNRLIDQHGNFKSLTQISGMLEKGLRGMSEAERSAALNAAFGSDASRAAIVLGKEGAGGLRKYIKATKDMGAAEKMAKANMSGTAGELERMQGAIETAGKSVGTFLAPAVRTAAKGVGKLAEGVQKSAEYLTEHKNVAIALGIAIGVLTGLTAAHSAVLAVGAAGGLAAWLRSTRLVSAATKVWAAVQWALNAAMSMNPIMLVVLAVGALVAAFVIAYKKSETFRNIVQGAMRGVKAAGAAVANFFTQKIPAAFGKVKDAAGRALGWVRDNWPKILAFLTGPIGIAVYAIAKNWDKIKSGAGKVKDFIVTKFTALVGFFKGLPGRFSNAVGGMFDGIKDAFRGAINWIIRKWNDLELSLKLPKIVGGGSIGIGTPNIPEFATGGRVTRETIARIGEREPETVLRDRDIKKLLTKARDAGRSENAGGGGRNAPLIGAVYQQPGEDPNVFAERVWFRTLTG